MDNKRPLSHLTATELANVLRALSGAGDLGRPGGPIANLVDETSARLEEQDKLIKDKVTFDLKGMSDDQLEQLKEAIRIELGDRWRARTLAPRCSCSSPNPFDAIIIGSDCPMHGDRR
jgi:hypothetical protein